MKSVENSSERVIGLFGATSIGVAAIIGGGILALAGAAFSSAGPSALLAIALNGAIALVTAMSFAELSTAFPQSGGAYVFANKVLSIRAAFGVGWVLWFAYIVACVLYALGFAAFAVLLLQEVFAAAGASPPDWLGSHTTMVLSVGIALLVYVPLLFVAATVGVPSGVSLAEFSAQHGDTVIAAAVREYMGPIGYWLVIAVAILAFLSALRANLMAGSRIVLSMALDRTLPTELGRVDQTRKTPVMAIYATGLGVVVVLLVVPNLEAAGAAASLIFLLSFALVHATAYLARKRVRPGAHTYKTPWFPLIPALGVTSCTMLGVFEAIAATARRSGCHRWASGASFRNLAGPPYAASRSSKLTPSGATETNAIRGRACAQE
jgi:amino acid transporter